MNYGKDMKEKLFYGDWIVLRFRRESSLKRELVG